MPKSDVYKADLESQDMVAQRQKHLRERIEYLIREDNGEALRKLLHDRKREIGDRVVIREASFKQRLGQEESSRFINMPDEFGFTYLHNAAVTGKEHAVEALLGVDNISTNKLTPRGQDKGEDENLFPVGGDTALHLAARKGYTNIVALLLAHKHVKPEIKNASGKTYKQVAIESGHPDIAEIAVPERCEPKRQRHSITSADEEYGSYYRY